MSEQLDKKDFITIIGAIDSSLEHIAGLGDDSLPNELKRVKDKIIRNLTWQPVEIPFCKCSRPDWNHSYTNVFCNHCYGFTSTFKL